NPGHRRRHESIQWPRTRSVVGQGDRIRSGPDGRPRDEVEPRRLLGTRWRSAADPERLRRLARQPTPHPYHDEESILPANNYEGMFLLDSSKAAAAWDDTVKHVHDILQRHHSEIVASRQWDERRLAYPISGHKKGTYLLTYFRTEGENLKEILADCHL